MKINVRVEKPLYAYEIEKIIEKYEVLYGLVMIKKPDRMFILYKKELKEKLEELSELDPDTKLLDVLRFLWNSEIKWIDNYLKTLEPDE